MIYLFVTSTLIRLSFAILLSNSHTSLSEDITRRLVNRGTQTCGLPRTIYTNNDHATATGRGPRAYKLHYKSVQERRSGLRERLAERH